MKTLIMTVGVIASTVAFAAAHLEVGLTPQDEAVALAIDEGLTQDRYLTLCYGEDAQSMLDAAFETRGSNFVEGVAFVRKMSGGDIRNVPCVESTKTRPSYMQFMKRNQGAVLKPGDTVPVSGRMYGQTNAFNVLVSKMSAKVGKAILLTGEGKHTFRDEFDPTSQSYSFWPLGCAIHEPDAYAEEIAHFFNFKDPRVPPRSFKGEWSDPDYAKVAKWNEFLAAYRGVKVYAYSLGFNLNDAPIGGVNTFDAFYNAIQGKLKAWRDGKSCPLANNAYVLFLAYGEAKAAEGLESDNSAYRRFREICRDNQIAKMIL